MKTIEEAAKEHQYPYNSKFGIWAIEIKHISRVSFKKGAEFAQRWIPVEEELPPCSYVDILIKGIDDRGIDGIVDIGYMHGSIDGKPSANNFISMAGVLIKVTHWRPIELK